ncbi:MAG TPA: hypothetical protein VF632_04840 [Longimicrobium sp.]
MAHNHPKGTGPITASLYESADASAVTSYATEELAQHFTELTIALDRPWPELRLWAEVRFDGEAVVSAHLVFVVDPERWAGPFSLFDFRKSVEEVAKRNGVSGLNFLDHRRDDTITTVLSGFAFAITIRDPTQALSKELTYWTAVVLPMLDHARAVLSAEAQRDTLVTLFDFPPALSTACEQYLLYFVQFLRDLGIEAEGDVRHRANRYCSVFGRTKARRPLTG